MGVSGEAWGGRVGECGEAWGGGEWGTAIRSVFFLLRKQSCYLCDELRPFVRTCVDKFERLEPVSISKTLETFFLKV